MAGSNGWFNYRHQADVCHAYQIVHAHGVPDDHIIVMMYDDIAYAKENLTPALWAAGSGTSILSIPYVLNWFHI